jgi:hypothetical protein
MYAFLLSITANPQEARDMTSGRWLLTLCGNQEEFAEGGASELWHVSLARTQFLKLLAKDDIDWVPAYRAAVNITAAYFADRQEGVNLLSRCLKKQAARNACNARNACCEFCGCTNVKLKACGQCHSVGYCNIECQRKHWKVHKTHCRQLAAQADTDVCALHDALHMLHGF